MNKPKKCCSIGSYEHQVPMPLNGRRQDVDLCIADIVAALNAANITTGASCCGHGKMDGTIILEDGRYLVIKKEICPTEFIDNGKGIIIRFLEYAPDTKISNRIQENIDSLGHKSYDVYWLAEIGGIMGEAKNPYRAMEIVLEIIESGKKDSNKQMEVQQKTTI